MRKKLADNIILDIKKILRESEHIPDKESRALIEDKEVSGYMELEIFEDQQSGMDNDDREPDEGEIVKALGEENVDMVLEEGDVVEVLEDGDAVAALEAGRCQAA